MINIETDESGSFMMVEGPDGPERVAVSEWGLNVARQTVDRSVFEGKAPAYVSLKDITGSFEMEGVNLDQLPLPGAGAFDISLSHAYRWSRWRRWLNAVLRVAWWPLGPRRLPVSFGLNISEMYVTMAELQADGHMRVEMSSRKP